ncbi:hypothetical protein HO133_000325 [Letharia lupina]|uniref:Uncharacterized protein n=1 Tax=Letharia lupina TaxID=560253 RepID=A0A8H6CHC4_9LECA|nr:uncharacterized protein HO133_000325 [Letharia lupina]KAF6223482.1 hypothetical protein HO133_000325 [Letharia lupina]
MDYLFAAWTVIYFIAYPIFYILKFILFLSAIITAPLLHLGHYCLYACWYVLRVLGKFETLYIFFGIATLVGLVTGTSLHYVSGFITSILNLDSLPEQQRGRTLASYRAEKQERRDAKDPIMELRQKDEGLQGNDLRLREDYMNWSLSKQGRGRGGPRFNTILEEEDTSDGF